MSQRTFVLPVKELGARYVMEGSLRQAGTKLRSSHRRMKRDVGATIQRDVERWRCSGSQVVADLSQLGTSGPVKCFGIS
jgi:hypothetical protein